MAPPSQKPTHEQVAALSAFTEDLQSQIEQCSPSALCVTDATLSTLDKYLDQFPVLVGTLRKSARRRFDSMGVELWNACTLLLAVHTQAPVLCVLTKVRAFAFALLDIAAPSQRPGDFRVLDLALRAGKACLDNEQLDLCLRVLGVAATRLDTLEQSGTSLDADKVPPVTVQYLMLRIHLACSQGRFDIAEHFIFRVPELRLEDQGSVSEMYHRVGRLALSNAEYDVALRWLRRALASSDVLSRGLQKPDLALRDQRLLILHGIVQASAKIHTPDSEAALSSVLGVLNTDYEGFFAAYMIQLEILGKEKTRCKEYFEALITAIRVMEFSDESFNAVIYYIQKLSHSDRGLAIEAFRELLITHLADPENKTSMEQGFVTFIWMLTASDSHAQNSLDFIIDVAQTLTEANQGPLSEEATHAALILIWRSISTAISDGQSDHAMHLCSAVVEQPMFQNCSAQNKAKFHRKCLNTALESEKVPITREALRNMHEDCKSSPLTQYLIFKLALMEGNSDLGLEVMHNLAGAREPHLLSCAAEAQRLGKMRQAVAIFQQVITSLDDRPEGLDVPGLFESTVSLLSKELKKHSNHSNKTAIVEELCAVFEAALKEAGKQNPSTHPKTFTADDFEWLYQNAFKLALQASKSASSGSVIKLLDASTKLANLFKQQLSPEKQVDLDQHHLYCDCLATIALVTDARTQKEVDEKKTHYYTVRNAARDFRTRIPSHLESCSVGQERNEWTERYRVVIALDFEAAVYLEQWNSLPSMIEEARNIVTDKLSSLFMNALLSADAPVREILRVVKTLICTFHKSFPKSLPRYLHCLFQLALSAEGETALAESALDQVLALARKNQSAPSSRYPDDEIEWLATVAFNRAVDFYFASADEDCRRWGRKAIEMADLVHGDDGALGQLLRGNMGRLGLDGS